MIIEAALQLQDGTEQDALQDMGSNMASACSTEQDTLQEMGSTGTCSTQEDDLPPLVHKGTRNSCKNVNLNINSLQNKMFSNCKEFDILSSDENRTSEEFEFEFWWLTPLSAIFQLYHGDQFKWWRKLEYPERTTDPGQATGKLYHLRL